MPFGLASHNFADTRGRFPDGVQIAQPPANGDQNMLSAYRTPGFGPNWAVLMLPYFEQGALFEQNSAGINNYLLSNGSDQSWRNLIAVKLTPFRCPSDPGHIKMFSLNGGPWARGNYGASAGPSWLNWTIGGKSNSGGARDGSVATFNAMAGGPFGVNYGCRMAELTGQDGSSNTILFGELRVGLNDQDRRGTWAMGVGGASIICAAAVGDAIIPNDANEYSDDIEDCNAVRVSLGVPTTSTPPGLGPKRMGCSNDNGPRNWPNWQAQSRSLHPAGVQVCFGDGSVRTVPNTIASSIWFLLLSREDGKAVPDF